MIDKLTVKQAKQEHDLKGFTLLRWINEKKIEAEKIGNAFFIDRASLDAHLAARRQPKAESKNTTDPVPLESTSTQPAAPVPPSVEPSPVETPQSEPQTVTPPPVETPSASAPKAEPPCDLHAGPKKNPEPRISAPPRKAEDVPAGAERKADKGKEGPQTHRKNAEMHVPQGDASDRKRQSKEAFREARKKFKKGPVHYAKDAMRHLDLAQLRDVRNWLLNRMDARMKLV